MKINLPAIFILILVSIAFANHTEYDVRVVVPGRLALRQLTDSGLGIYNYNSTTGEAYGTILERNLPYLQSLGYPVEILPETDARVLAAQRREPSGYPTLSEYNNFLVETVTDHSVFASLDTFGWSQDGNPLLMLKISDHAAWDEPEPEICFMSTMHGDEPPGTIFLMWFIDSLTDNYGSDSRLTRLVDSCEIFICPILNPDGYDNGTHDPRRYLSCGVDMNRNFPVVDGVKGNDGTFTVYNETIAVMDWFKSRFINYTINFHTGALLANYPWDFTSVRSTDDSLYKYLALNYSKRNSPMFSSTSFPQGITNGYDWYEVDGSMQDWTIWTRGDLHITVELYNIKCPSYSILYGLWGDNYDAFCAGIENTLNHAVEGIVTDSVTGDSLGATVDIDGIEQMAYSSPVNGYYCRLLLPGNYDIKFTCPGYYDKTVSVMVPDSGRARADVELIPMNPIYIYQTDFESDNGGLTTADFPYNEDWEYGSPHRGTIEPYSGTNVWGTELSGEYHDSSQSRLILSDIDLPEADSITLSFMQWYSFQGISGGGYHDGGNLKLWLSSSDSTILSPTPDYNHTMSEWNRLIAYQDAFGNLNQRIWWHEIRVDLSPWAGETVDISWDFGSSSVNTQVGWYIDDIAIYRPNFATIATEDNRRYPDKLTLDIFPNPFNTSCAINIRPGSAIIERLSVYDIDGKLVRTIDVRSKTVIWDGRDNSGTELSSGIYFIKAGSNIVNKTILLK